ncbi:hypothetical protein CEXT_605722 [Caerostris extrusa]|uniref:Guanine nucleotide exchange factor DBS n=1 Tax=Caerostris extrusa TaxID=172846 RepID=A0AAV4PAU6_CAEEX|nr:hypothetical protein CEXT_605722 [Caerostris extrusa]
MEENSCSLCVQDVAHLLQNKYAVITGGKTLDGFPIITFPDSTVEFLNLSEDEFKKLMLFLTSVPSMQDADRGFVLIIDRRNDKWSSVKTILLKIAGFFPALIQLVFVLRPAGFLQKAISGVSNKFFKEEFKFKVIVCTSVEELHTHIDISQLTNDLGGTIAYDLNDWIQQRTAVERFSANTKEISITLQDLIVQLQASVLPNDVPTTMAFIEEHTKEHHELKDDIQSAIRHGETLLSCIRRPSVEDASLDLCPDKLVNVAAVERLLIQLEETEKNFDSFWDEHMKKLQQCLELRHFEQDFKEVQSVLSSCLDKISDMPISGDSVSKVREALKDADLNRAVEVQEQGQKLIENNHYAIDSISPKCVELEKMVGDLKQQLQRKLDMLRKYCDLHEKLKRQIFGISAELENHSILDGTISPETRALVQQVLKRLEDMQTVCEKRKSSLEKLAAKPVRPIQAVVPEPKVPSHPPLRRPSPDGEKKILRKGTKATIEICFEENEAEVASYFQPIQTLSNNSSPRNSADILRLKENLEGCSSTPEQECQRNLGHKLPLGAYLLKPVQRITKYQLLLQDLLKFCEESITELKEALDTMLTVLKYVNDSMHQVAITGFHFYSPKNMAEKKVQVMHLKMLSKLPKLG